MAATAPHAFLSYTRLDDEFHGGAITALRRQLELGVRVVTGDRSFTIFQDVDGIEFGQHWPSRLDEALAQAQFLIPVLTPSFFRSDPCRDELAKFLELERRAGRQDLILPLYLVRTPLLEQAALRDADPLARVMAERQRRDWRSHAYMAADHPDLRRAVHELAEAVAAALERAAPTPRLTAEPARRPEPEPPARGDHLLTPGTVFRDVDAPWCPEMVVVPAGSFLMGSPKGEAGRNDAEGPQHRVTIARPFAVGRYTVTFDEWDACVAGGGCGGYRPADGGWGRGRRPVINVSWDDAQAYVRWLAEKTGKPYRLLSEAEWEYAARGGTTTPFWTGETISTAQANYDGNYAYGKGKKGEYRERTVSVDDPGFPANPFGLHHVHGNVWEWCADDWHGSYEGAPSDGRPWLDDPRSPSRVVRGGSWDDDPGGARSAYRVRSEPENRDDDLGFRVSRMLTP